MKIALSTSVVQRGRSGVGQHVLSLVRALLPAAARHEFTLFILEEDLPLFSFASGAMRLEPVPERHRPPVRDILWHQAALPRLVRRLGIDVLHVPSYRRMLWPRPCALVATIHDLAPFHLPGKYDWARMFYGRVIARRLAQRQDEIVAVSRATARDVELLFRVPARRVTVIPNGVDHGHFRPGPKAGAIDAVCAPLGLHSPFFLYVARLEHPAKNHAGLIDAFNRFKSATKSTWHLVLAGGDWHGAQTIHNLVRTSPFARDIEILGFVPAASLPDWYRAADVLVFPSLCEGFGLPVLEAMACGCPVLSSTEGALEETVGTAAGRLEPRDVGQIQAQLTRAAADRGWREQLRSAGFSQARAFDWRATAEATLGVYARAASRFARSRAIGRQDTVPSGSPAARPLSDASSGDLAPPAGVSTAGPTPS
ncbi:MAG TPA: glycosyltransferase family 1 protein [Bryobacteraceae bacterium]|nr:glycosyltransferase family 1 protein [Bryobacteraceae bacterium]